VELDAKTLTVEDRTPAEGARAEQPALVLALSCAPALLMPCRHLLGQVDEVVIGRGSEQRATRRRDGGLRQLQLTLPDPRISSSHARLARLDGGWVIEDASSKNGTLVNGAPQQTAPLQDGDLVELGHSFLVFSSGHPVSAAPPDLAADALPLGTPELATFDPGLAAELDGLTRLAPSTVSMLLRGPTGSGKEVVARALHQLSGRRGPFRAVNCGALPGELVEAELFGHRRGAYTGAVEDRPGLIRSAQGGTLLLDEIGDLPLASQPALLRVLQEREVLPVGAAEAVPVDVRIVSATHRELEVMAEAGTFRRDLLARLAGHTVTLPPLARRRCDLGLLVRALLARLGGTQAAFTPRAARALFLHGWPLNVRELAACLASALVLAGQAPIDLEHLPETVRASTRPLPASSADEGRGDEELRRRLVGLLRQHRGNVTLVARELGKARMQIHRWVKRLGLSLADYR